VLYIAYEYSCHDGTFNMLMGFFVVRYSYNVRYRNPTAGCRLDLKYSSLWFVVPCSIIIIKAVYMPVKATKCTNWNNAECQLFFS
jgi:hypothetical protein